MAGTVGDRAQRAATGGHGLDLAEPVIGPADKDNRSAVARPGGKEFELIAAGQPSGRPAANGLGIELAKAFKQDGPAIGRYRGEARHLAGETVGSNGDLRMRGVGHAASITDAERDHRCGAAVGRNPLDFAAGPEDYALAVRRPVHVRIDARHRPGFLHILIEIIIDLALDPRFQILHIEFGLGHLAADKGDLLAIGRGAGADRAAETGDGGRHFTRFQVILFDIEQVAVAVLGIDEGAAGSDVAGIIDRLAVGCVNRFAKLLLVRFARFLDQLHPAAAGDMVDPDFPRAQRTLGGEMFLGHDIAAVGAPARLVEQAEFFLGHLLLVAAVAVHDPDIVTAAPVGGEGDAVAVGREARLDFPGQTLGDPDRRPAGDRHGVDIAEQGKGDAVAVRADVDVDPAALVDVDRNLLDRRAGWRVDIPFAFFGLVLGKGCP